MSSSSVTFADFGGNEGVLVNIAKLLVHLKHPEVYQKLGVTPPRGFLLHGPPGCGKTLLGNIMILLEIRGANAPLFLATYKH